VNPEEQLRVARALMRSYRDALRRARDMVERAPQSRLATADRAQMLRALGLLQADFTANEPAFIAALARESGDEALGIARGRWDVMRAALAAATAAVQAQPWYARLLAAVERAAAGAADGAADALRIFGGGFGAGAIIAVVVVLALAGKK
jgi:hypothetical protein